MRFDPAFRDGVLKRRYKRFLADVETEPGLVVTMHCPNTGAMLGCADPESRVWYSTSTNPKRKYAHTLELVETGVSALVGVNTARANALVAEALERGLAPSLARLTQLRREVAVPDERGRFDFAAVDETGGAVFIEVKSATLGEANGRGYFPDAVSTRAQRHVEALARCVERGDRGVLVFCVQHTAVVSVAPAEHIDPAYAAALRAAAETGVEVYALGAEITPGRIELVRELPVLL